MSSPASIDQPQALALRLDRPHRADPVDVALDDVAAHRVAGPERRLEVDARAVDELPERRAGQRLGHGMEASGASAPTDSAVRQTPLIETEPPTSTSGAVAGASISRRTPSSPPVDGDDRSDLTHDAR